MNKLTKTVEAAGMLLMTVTPPQQILLLRHHDRWDLPKGHVEEGESLRQAALRETQEETGIDPSTIVLDPNFSFALEYEVTHSKRGAYQKRVTYFLGFIPSPMPIQLTEHLDYKWWDWPTSGEIQSQTIDPLIKSVKSFLDIA